MKRLTFLLVVLFAFVLTASAQNDIRTSVSNDVNPLSINLAPLAGENDYPFAIGDLLKNHNVDSLIGTVYGYGVCWTGTHYVTSRFSTVNMFNRMNSSWVKVDSFPASGAGTGFFRDLAYANGKIWGSPLSGIVYGINPNTGVMEKTITMSGAASIRALTWDPVRKGFWCGTNTFTGPLKCYDTLGNAIAGASITTPASGLYGVAYDDDPAGPFLWISTDQTPASNTGTAFVKYNATTLAQIGTPLNVTVPLTSGAPLASGGCEVTTTLIPGKRVIVGMVQGTPDRVIVVEIGNTTAARTWTEQTSGLATALYSVSAVSDDVAWACGTSGKVLRTTNKGLTWTNVSGNLPATALLYNIFAWDANTAITTASPSGSVMIYKTSNGGVNWVTAFSLTATGAFGDDLWMTSATDAYYIGDPQGGNWHLLKSTNGGNNWGAWSTLATTNTAGTYNNAAWFQGTQVWFPSVGQSHILYSSNMGTNWVQQPITLSEITAICFNSPTTGLAGGSSTSVGLLKTTNGGTNWAAVTAPFATLSISGIAGSGSEYWASLQSTAIHYSSNDGANWSLAYTAPAGSFYHLTKSRTGNTLWGVRANGAITRYGVPIVGVTPISTTVPDNFSLGQNYPNPFNPTTNIKFAVPQSGLVTIKVYDLLGKEIATLVNEVKNAGSYVVDFNASTLASGVYFYKMEVNGFREVKRMTLIK